MLTDNETIALEELPEFLWKEEAVIDSPPVGAVAPPLTDDCMSAAEPGHLSLDEAINRASKNALVRALREAGGNCHRAAVLLGVSRYTVYRMIARYGLARRERNNLGIHAVASAEA
jgi:transcriptional regulator of acetoin/glycerol metabolism